MWETSGEKKQDIFSLAVPRFRLIVLSGTGEQ